MNWRILMVLAVLSSCANPDDIFPVTGTVVSKAGSAGLTVQLLRQIEFAADACHFEGLQPMTEALTDADGGYGFEVFRAQSQSLSNGQAYCFMVRVTFPSGAESHVQIRRIDDEIHLPPLPDWVPNPRIEDEVLKFEPALDDLGTDLLGERYVMHRSSFRVENDEVKWEAFDLLVVDAGIRSREGNFSQVARVAMAYPPEAFEDFAGTVRLEAIIQYSGRGEPGIPLLDRPDRRAINVTPAQVLDVHGNRVPVSRGLTRQPDGDGYRFDFAVPTPVSSVVLRGTDVLGSVRVVAGVDHAFEFPVFPPLWGSGDGLTFNTYGAWRFDAGTPVDSVSVFPAGESPEDGGFSVF